MCPRVSVVTHSPLTLITRWQCQPGKCPCVRGTWLHPHLNAGLHRAVPEARGAGTGAEGGDTKRVVGQGGGGRCFCSCGSLKVGISDSSCFSSCHFYSPLSESTSVRPAQTQDSNTGPQEQPSRGESVSQELSTLPSSLCILAPWTPGKRQGYNLQMRNGAQRCQGACWSHRAGTWTQTHFRAGCLPHIALEASREDWVIPGGWSQGKQALETEIVPPSLKPWGPSLLKVGNDYREFNVQENNSTSDSEQAL